MTTGEMTLVAVMPADGTGKDDLLRYAAAVEHASEHAVARAIAAAFEPEPLPPVDGFQALPGLGARGTVDGHSVLVGRRLLFADVPADLAAWCAEQERSGSTTVLETGNLTSGALTMVGAKVSTVLSGGGPSSIAIE